MTLLLATFTLRSAANNTHSKHVQDRAGGKKLDHVALDRLQDHQQPAHVGPYDSWSAGMYMYTAAAGSKSKRSA
jgi:hypothetical protein